MLNIQRVGIKAIIDARELVNQGIHPRGQIIEFVKQTEPAVYLTCQFG